MAPPESPLAERLERFRAEHPVRELAHGGEIWRYRLIGDGGAPVLWLTGALGTGDLGFVPMQEMGDAFRILVPDYPAVAALDDFVAGLIALLDAEGHGAVHVVAGSFGGMVAQHLVRQHAERVQSLVLSHTMAPNPHSRGVRIARAVVATIGLWPAPLLRVMFFRRLRASFDVDPFWLRYFDETVAGLTKADIVSRVRLAAEFVGCRYTAADLRDWSGRVLIVDADNDPQMPETARAALRALYPNAHAYAFSGTGHSAAIAHPEEYAGVIRDFLHVDLT